jgi:hypothetical protein
VRVDIDAGLFEVEDWMFDLANRTFDLEDPICALLNRISDVEAPFSEIDARSPRTSIFAQHGSARGR